MSRRELAGELWRRGKACELAALTGHPVAEWDRLLNAYATAGWDVDAIEHAYAEGIEVDPVREAELVEQSMAYACGRLSIQLRALRAAAVDAIRDSWDVIKRGR